VFLDPDDAGVRQQEGAALGRWLKGEAAPQNPLFPKPNAGAVAVLGDFNAELDDPNHSLDPLRQGSLSAWSWSLDIGLDAAAQVARGEATRRHDPGQ
jgi:hypothetical protein